MYTVGLHLFRQVDGLNPNYWHHIPTDILVGLLRLRKCSEETFRPELKGGVSVVRELHVYGSVVPVNARDPAKFQHQVDRTRIYRKYKLTAPLCLACTVGIWNDADGGSRENSIAGAWVTQDFCYIRFVQLLVHIVSCMGMLHTTYCLNARCFMSPLCLYLWC